jgi:DNA-binding IclR family transcriptional regulator
MFSPDYDGIGAPVHDVDGSTVSEVSIGGPTYQVSVAQLEREFVDDLLDATGEIEPLL